MRKTNYDVPVLMYHSIGIPNKKWNWNYLTCPINHFEEQLQAIKSLGYTTISLNKLYEYMVKGLDVPKKSIALTFDDGYADIWIYAYPLLKKYDMCGTVFINPDFVDRRKIKRKTNSGEINISKIDDYGFLSWDEIITMDQEKVIFSESHALTHTWYPNTNEIIDFRHPNDNYTWMTWNSHLHLKPLLQIDDKSLVDYGEPVYKNKKSLISRRYFPDANLKIEIITFVQNNGGNDFFLKENWRETLFNEVKVFYERNKIEDRIETIDEYKLRIQYELKYTKEILEEKLNRKILFLCWPGGSATEIGMKIAKELGYKFFNSARDMTFSQRKSVKNVRNGGIRIKRFTPKIYFNGQENKKSNILYANSFWMKILLIRYSEKYFSIYWFKIMTIVINGFLRLFPKSTFISHNSYKK